MFKRILFSFMVIVAAASVALGVYTVFDPNTSEVVDNPSNTFYIDYESLNDYTLNSGDSATHYYFFCSPTNADCQYVENTLFKTIVQENSDIDTNDVFEYVDVSVLEENFTTNRLKNEWNVDYYPAFVSCTVNNGSITINNFIEWSPEEPLSANDLKLWMINNEIWPGADKTDALLPSSSAN